jgi:hypothetical protein
MIKISVAHPDYRAGATTQASGLLAGAHVHHMVEGDLISVLYSTQFERGYTRLLEAGFEIVLRP